MITKQQRETIADAAAMLDGLALELRMSHATPSSPLVIQEPEVASAYQKIKRMVAQLYEISEGKPNGLSKQSNLSR